MSTRLYGLKNCDTCRKALKALDAAGVTYQFHDVRADGVDKSHIAGWVKAAGWEALMNKRSTTWRDLPDTEKDNVDEAKAISLMAAHPTLIKRPVIEKDGLVLVGWTRETQEALR